MEGANPLLMWKFLRLANFFLPDSLGVVVGWVHMWSKLRWALQWSIATPRSYSDGYACSNSESGYAGICSRTRVVEFNAVFYWIHSLSDAAGYLLLDSTVISRRIQVLQWIAADSYWLKVGDLVYTTFECPTATGQEGFPAHRCIYYLRDSARECGGQLLRLLGCPSDSRHNQSPKTEETSGPLGIISPPSLSSRVSYF